MSTNTAPSSTHVATPLLLALVVTACGGSSPPPAPTLDAPPPGLTAAPPASAAASAGPDKDAVLACLAAAGAKRARFSGEPAKVGVKHVLVKYKGAKNAKDDISRTREEACLRAIEARDKVRAGVDFADVVKAYSDEPGAATRDGSIGMVERREVAPPFADAAFELSINQMSDVVETEFGFHIIMRNQ